MISRVRTFNDAKGYGFIRNPNKGDKDIFVHWSEIVSDNAHKSLDAEDRVEFEVEESEKGLKAKQVRVIHVEGNDDRGVSEVSADEGRRRIHQRRERHFG
jgi:CspA family cold shock protein